jgi:hypothetical protein
MHAVIGKSPPLVRWIMDGGFALLPERNLMFPASAFTGSSLGYVETQ